MFFLFFFNDTATTEIYTLSLHDALPILASYGVDVLFFEDDSRPTSLKQRFRAAGKTLLRVSHLKQHGIEAELQDQIVGAVRANLATLDLLIFADFNYGCLPQKLVDDIAALCAANGI